MTCNFHVGQKVVCVGCEGTPRPKGYWEKWQKDWNVTLPQRGVIYTVRDARMTPTGVGFIRVCEIRNPDVEYIDARHQEPWFFSEGFRPVVERKTDISIFNAMLTPKTEQVPA
jgi:hypothetical protein